jgi:hypothetical protein
VFRDTGFAIDRDGEKFTPSLPEIEDRLDKVIDRIDALAPSYEKLAANDVNPPKRARNIWTFPQSSQS